MVIDALTRFSQHVYAGFQIIYTDLCWYWIVFYKLIFDRERKENHFKFIWKSKSMLFQIFLSSRCTCTWETMYFSFFINYHIFISLSLINKRWYSIKTIFAAYTCQLVSTTFISYVQSFKWYSVKDIPKKILRQTVYKGWLL